MHSQESSSGSTAISMGVLARCLLDFQAYPGRYPVARREPRILFDQATTVLLLAAGRAVDGLPEDPEFERQLRSAARFFVQAGMLRPGNDHYALMGVTPDSDAGSLRDNYRLLMRLTHPDFAANGEVWPADAATRINQANDVLSSPERREVYSQALRRSPNWHAPDAVRVLPVPLQDTHNKPRRRWTGVAAGAGVSLAVLMAASLWPSSEEAPDNVADAPGSAASAPASVSPLATNRDQTGVSTLPQQSGSQVMAATPDERASQGVINAASPAVVVASSEPLRKELPLTSVPAIALAHTGPVLLPPSPASMPALRPARENGSGAVVHAASLKTAPMALVSTPPVPVAAAAPLPLALAPVSAPAPVNAPVPVSAPTPAPVPVSAPAPAPASASGVRMADVQPLLGQLLSALQSGRGEQVARLVDASARQGDGSDRLVDAYNRITSGARVVRLGSVQFASRGAGEQLIVDGVVLMHLQEDSGVPSTHELVLRAQFAARGGQPVLTQITVGGR